MHGYCCAHAGCLASVDVKSGANQLDTHPTLHSIALLRVNGKAVSRSRHTPASAPKGHCRFKRRTGRPLRQMTFVSQRLHSLLLAAQQPCSGWRAVGRFRSIRRNRHCPRGIKLTKQPASPCKQIHNTLYYRVRCNNPSYDAITRAVSAFRHNHV